MGGIRSLFIGDAHLEVCRHGAMIQLVYLSHVKSSWRGRPQYRQHTGPNSKKFRAKILELFCVLVGRFGRGDIEVRFSRLLTWLPESDFDNVPQIPWQGPG